MVQQPESGSEVPASFLSFDHRPESDQSFENALEKARQGTRLTVDDGVELLTTGTDRVGIDPNRKEAVFRVADNRRAAVVGDEITFVAAINNNVTTACDTGCLFCNFKDSARQFEVDHDAAHAGFTKTPAESHEIVRDAVSRGIYEVCSVSGLHPALTLDDAHRETLEASAHAHSKACPQHNYKPPAVYDTDPGTYVDQIRAMSTDGVHVHSMTPEEASHARRGTSRSFEDVYAQLSSVGLDSVPGTAAEILVEEVRDVICPEKISTGAWLDAMEGAATAGLDMTATMLYGHVENERHRIMHLKRIRDLQDRTGAITEFVPLSFVVPNTPLAELGLVDSSLPPDADKLVIAVSRLFLDNIENIQSSWVKYGDQLGLEMMTCGANDFMGTLLSEEITKRAGGDHGEFRSFQEYVDMITAIGRVPVERSTDYRTRHRIDPAETPIGPRLGPQADGTPLLGS